MPPTPRSIARSGGLDLLFGNQKEVHAEVPLQEAGAGQQQQASGGGEAGARAVPPDRAPPPPTRCCSS